MIVEWTINGVFDPFVELFLGLVGDVEVGEELGAEGQIGDFVVGSNIVNVVDFTLVENGVESIGCVTSKEVTAGWGSVSVENNGLTAVKEEGELGDNFWGI